MNVWLAMVAVRTLPPPPTPTSNPTIDTARVIGIVLISLGLIALVTLLLRPLVLRRHVRPAPAVEEAPTAGEPVDAAAEPADERGLIRFPTPFPVESVPSWQVSDPAVAERLQRLVGQRDRRRKLGDRNPSRNASPSFGGRERRSREVSQNVSPRHGAQPIGTVIPIYDRPAAQSAGARATGTSEWSASTPPLERPERTWTDPQAGTRPHDRTGADNPRRPLAPVKCERGTGHAEPEKAPGVPQATPTDPVAAELPVEDRVLAETPQTVKPPAPAASEDERAEITLEPDAVEINDDWFVSAEPGGPLAEAVEELTGTPADEPADIELPRESGAAVSDEGADIPRPLRQTDQLAFAGKDDGADGSVVEPVADDLPAVDEAESGTSEVAVEPVVSGDAIPPETLHEITLAIRELIFCANTGEVLRGLALYSDAHLFRFMDSTGMSEDEFRETFAVAHPRAPETWERLDTLRDLARLPDGRIEVTVSYIDPRGQSSDGLERYRFVYEQDHRLWMIDDIIQLPPLE